MKKSSPGFTLIELLVVIAIIGLLASIILASLHIARIKGQDSKRIAEFREFKTALKLYYEKHGRYPSYSINCAVMPCEEAQHNSNFRQVAMTLKSEGFLSSIPVAPSSFRPYMLYDYGSGTVPGFLLVTGLESIDPTISAPYNSCRPFFSVSWCSSEMSSKDYCICIPY